MYLSEQGLFKTELSIQQGTIGYRAFMRLRGGEEVHAEIGTLPKLPAPGTGSPKEYGQILAEWVFRGELRDGLTLFSELSCRDPSGPPSMRVLLRLDPSSPLSDLLWEAMWLSSCAEHPISIVTAFSRYAHASTPSRPTVWERPVRILLIVSNPEGLQRFDLASVDSDLEKKVLYGAERRLEGRIEVKRLLRPTLADIRNEEQVGYHITHLLAHAMIVDGVMLADNHGEATIVRIEEVADAIASPSDPHAPYLVFLALPLNAGAPSGRVFVELASLLAGSGVQSVVVIQGPVERKPLTAFVERFYEVLLDTGAIDVAVTEARKRLYVTSPSDWTWTWPTLFTRAADSSIQERLSLDLESALSQVRFY
jgi:hypothetical protein